jgi:DNA-binding NarL/FixJ family response regulator
MDRHRSKTSKRRSQRPVASETQDAKSLPEPRSEENFSKSGHALSQRELRSGARGYVLKSDADSELVAAVRHVQQHKPFFTGRLAMTMVESFVNEQREGEPSADHPLPGCPLTAREIEIVQLLATGKISKEVAATVGISTRTVESHRNHIMKKMNFSSFSELMRFAIRNHLVEP